MLRHLRNTDSSETNTDYQQVLDKIRYGIFVVSRSDGVLLYSNTRAKEWFGANIGEALEDVLEYGLLESEEVEMEISSPLPVRPEVDFAFGSRLGRSDACLISMRKSPSKSGQKTLF